MQEPMLSMNEKHEPNKENEDLCKNRDERPVVGTVSRRGDEEADPTLTPEKVAMRVGNLLYQCKDQSAKDALERTLVYFPDNVKLMELENQCDCFLTRNFENYLKMLSVRTFLLEEEASRYRREISGFCKMVGEKATHGLNIPLQRRQNTENYLAIVRYIALLKQCLRRKVIVEQGALYECIRQAVLKLTAIICNTIYLREAHGPKRYLMLIDFKYRAQLKADFEEISPYGESEYEIVDEREIRRYVGGRNE